MTAGPPQAPLAFITGASSGIGQALAACYARQGWRLALLVRQAGRTQAWCRAQGLDAARCAVFEADVRDVDATVAAGLACLDRLGLPDVVIANAGLSVGVDTAIREDLEVVRTTLDTHVLGMAATFHPFVAPMAGRGRGSLVGVASVAAVRGLPGHAAYCASKAGVVSYCESLRGELRGRGVRVTTLVPGYVDTPLTRGNRYAMPFLMTADAFAERAVRTIAAGASYRVIPWQMGVGPADEGLPDGWFDRLAAGRGRKRRLGE